MSERPALRALAEWAGIARSYVGYDRRPVEVTDATCEILLRALGLDAASEAEATRLLEVRAGAARRAAIEPVRVVRAGTPELAQVHARLPHAPRSRIEYQLSLRLESGARHEATGAVDARPEADGAAVVMPLPGASELSFGYHGLRCELACDGATVSGEQDLIVAPKACAQVAQRVGERRAIGLWTHLYTLRSRRDAGIGDLSDLRALAMWAAGRGLEFVGINPLHATDNGAPEVSPYYPLSRLYRNPIYIDIEAAIARTGASEAFLLLRAPEHGALIRKLRGLPRIDYVRVQGAKRKVLEAVHRHFARAHRGAQTELGRAYATYTKREGQPLVDFGRFSALLERLSADDPRCRDFRAWPSALQDASSPAVAEFAREHAELVDFHCFLQFELDEQLGACQRAARASGMAIGLYGDLAVGDAPFAADVWARPALYARGVHVGAPPDPYSSTGQDWGLIPINPIALREDRYQLWIALLRRAFRHSGMLRIDHVMGLARQFWVPAGQTAQSGGYVRFPREDLYGILAVESRRALALVVGEDLGVVPEGMREEMDKNGMLRSQVLYFERRHDGQFTPPREHARKALVTASTHDLPPIAGWFAGRDLEVRRAAGNIPDDAQLADARAEREHAKREFVALLRREGLLPEDQEPTIEQIAEAAQVALAGSAARVVGVALDDLTLEIESLNTPASFLADAPNWSRRLGCEIESLSANEPIARLLARLRERAARD